MSKMCANCANRMPSGENRPRPNGHGLTSCQLDSLECLMKDGQFKNQYSLWKEKTKMKEDKKVQVNPSVEQSENLINAFDYLNQKLFNGALPRPMLLFTRNPKILGGYFSNEKWFNTDGTKADEIALNANQLVEGDEIEIFGILIHEMTHQWQFHYGSPGRGGYHNREWADFCLTIGLKPINVKDPDAETGDAINTILVKGGRAMLALANMPETITIPFYSELMDAPSAPEEPKGPQAPEEVPVPKPKSGSRTKYTCTICGTNLWGKNGLKIMCMACDQVFTETV